MREGMPAFPRMPLESLAMVAPLVPRLATPDDAELIGRIGAAGFYDDPIMSWAIPDPDARRLKLAIMFTGLARDMTTDPGSQVWIVDDAAIAMWRDPNYAHFEPETSGADDDADSDTDSNGPSSPPLFDEDEQARFAAMRASMLEHHSREPHWYLNVLSTEPARQGQGLGTAVLAPVLERCDAEQVGAYLESTNPRNRTLYRRSGFVDRDEMVFADSPGMLSMWRAPQP
jgi:GNAT superfamily N-acetyltransferase